MKDSLRDALHFEHIELCETPDNDKRFDAVSFSKSNLKELKAAEPDLSGVKLNRMRVTSSLSTLKLKRMQVQREMYKKFPVDKECKKKAQSVLKKYYTSLKDAKMKVEFEQEENESKKKNTPVERPPSAEPEILLVTKKEEQSDEFDKLDFLNNDKKDDTIGPAVAQ